MAPRCLSMGLLPQSERMAESFWIMMFHRKSLFTCKTPILYWAKTTSDLGIQGSWTGQAGVDCNSASGKRLEMSLKKLSQMLGLSMRCLIENEMWFSVTSCTQIRGPCFSKQFVSICPCEFCVFLLAVSSYFLFSL